MTKSAPFLVLLLFALPCETTFAQGNQPRKDRFQLKDVFELEFASDPQISPDGKHIVYVRNFMDIMKDRGRSNLWIIDTDGKNHRALTKGNENHRSPRWSPDGKRLVYVSSEEGSSQIYCRWMDTGDTAKLTRLNQSPSGLVWSPDGKQIAFTMFVEEKTKPFVKLPAKPKGAEWAASPKVIGKVKYRFDGRGYLKDGYSHLFVIPAIGGTPRQLTSGPYHHRGTPSWTPDSQALVFSANRTKDADYNPRESDIYEVSLKDRKIKQLTDRKGPDTSPVVTPNGRNIVYLGFDDRKQGYQVTHLYAMTRDGTKRKLLLGKLDRDVSELHVQKDPLAIYFQYDDQGVTKIARLEPELRNLAGNVGGTTLGRPYSSGSFSVSNSGSIAFTITDPQHPADVAILDKPGGKIRKLTSLNSDVFADKKLGTVEEIWFKSSHDKRKVQGWILKPPGFDPDKKYPLILEIHGGPFANYGPRFSAEMQLYAANGYVVLFINPRGSTGYGQEFGNLIHHAYPGHDYDDLMSGVDAVIAKGYIDENNLFVTGGSGGGVLSAWIVGKTNRFRGAVVCKPVIDWLSFVLTADASAFFSQYWFPTVPWKNQEHYWKRSPLSLVGNVKTPTMLLTGEKDYRTPISQTEEFYQALKLRKVETLMVRIPGASHGIAARPSQLIAKVACILRWFEMHKRKG